MNDIMDEKKEFMKSKFDFLLANGFSYLGEQETNIIFIFRYKKGNIIFLTSYDFMEEFIGVSLRDENNHNDVINYLTNVLDAKIGSEEEREKIKTSIQNVYKDSKKCKYLMPIEHFKAIVNLYADFVEKHIYEISNWRYEKYAEA